MASNIGPTTLLACRRTRRGAGGRRGFRKRGGTFVTLLASPETIMRTALQSTQPASSIGRRLSQTNPLREPSPHKMLASTPRDGHALSGTMKSLGWLGPVNVGDRITIARAEGQPAHIGSRRGPPARQPIDPDRYIRHRASAPARDEQDRGRAGCPHGTLHHRSAQYCSVRADPGL